MPVIDVDSHFLEPTDWPEVTGPELPEQIAPPVTFFDFMRFGSAGLMPMLAEEDRPEDPADVMPKSVRYLMERLSALQPDAFDPSGNDPYYADAARVKKLCEDHLPTDETVRADFFGSSMAEVLNLS